MADKNIKISIIVDQNSAANAKRLIADINSEVRKLIENAQRATQALGGGGGGGVKVGNQNISVPGLGGTQGASASIATGSTGQGVGGIFGSIAGGISGIKSAIFGSKAIFKDISDGLKTFSDQGTASINTLTESVQRLNSALGSVKNAASNMGGVGGGFGGGFGGSFGGGGRGPTGTLLGMGPQNFTGAPMPTAPGAVQIAAPPAGQAAAPSSGGGLGAVGRMVGLVGVASSGIARQVVSDLTDPDTYSRKATDADIAQLSFSKNAPSMGLQRSAAWGVFERQAERIRTGDIRGIIAQRMEPRLIAAITAKADPAYQENVRRLAKMQLGMPEETGGLANSWNALTDILGSKISKIRQGALEYAESKATNLPEFATMSAKQRQANSEYGKTKREIALQNMEQQIALAVPQSIMEDQQLAEQTHLRTQRVGQEIYGGAMGIEALARAGGMGGVGRVNSRTGNLRYMEQEANLMKRGYRFGDKSAAQAAAIGGIGWEYKGAGMSMLGMQQGGFGASMGMGAAAAMTGTSAGGMGGFLQQVQGAIGSGGIEIGAANRFAGAFAGQMQASTGLGGLNYGSAFQQAAGSIRDLGGDQNAARIYMSGMQETQALQTGGKDPLQQGLNMHSGVKAFGANWQASDMMTKLSQTDRTAIMAEYKKNGKFPRYLTDLGITPQAMQVYMDDQDRMALVRYAGTPGVKGTKAFHAAETFMGSSGIKDYVSKMGSEGIKQKDALRMLGSAYGAAGSDPSSGLGMVQGMAERAGLVTPSSRGRGAHAVKAGGLVQASLDSQSEMRGEEAKLAGSGAPELAADFKGAPARARLNESTARAGAQLAMSPEGVTAVLKAFVDAIQKATSAIERGNKNARVGG